MFESENGHSDPASVPTPDSGTSFDVDWLHEQYNLNMAALSDLGFGEQDGVPPLESIRDSFGPADLGWLGHQATYGFRPQLIVAAPVQAVGLMGTRHEPGLVPRFNQKQGFNRRAFVTRFMKEEFNDKDPLHDNNNSGVFSVAILLDGRINMLTDSSAARSDNGPELAYIDSTPVPVKRDLLEAEQASQAEAGRDIQAISFSQIISLEAQKRLTGPAEHHQQLGSVALVHYPEINKNSKFGPSANKYLLPTSYSTNRLQLGERWMLLANEAVWRVLRLPIKTDPEV